VPANHAAGAGRKRRRRKRKPDTQGTSPQEPAANANLTSGPQGSRGHDGGSRQKQGDGQRKRKRRGGGGERPPTVLERVERAATSEGIPGPVDTESPLSEHEVQEFKRQLAFLRDYKKTLKLKLNAQEDLLLNGAREPDSRGVCHHLLSKVDYATVQRALEKLPADERPRLIGGVLDWKPDLSFLLLYLESLKEAGHGEATRALEGALERIDYASVSEGQMRRVLDLIVELFPEGRRGSLLLGLLANRSFRTAFDQSLAKLPTALAELVAPVRALQAVVLEGRPNPTTDAMLVLGLELVIKDGFSSFERRPPRTRARLIEVVCRKAPELVEQHFGAVQRLLNGFAVAAPERRDLELGVAKALLALGRTDRAARRLGELTGLFPNDAEIAQLERTLKAPRFGRYALLRGGSSPPPEHLNEAVDLGTQRPVWLRVIAPNASERAAAVLGLHRRISGPGVARFLAEEALGERQIVAFERRAEPLLPSHPSLKNRSGAVDAALQIARLANALARAGTTLPDLGPRRFEVQGGAESGIALTLVNTWDLMENSPEVAVPHMLGLVRQLPFLARNLSQKENTTLAAAADFHSLETALDALLWNP
jgi:hypothetical protein